MRGKVKFVGLVAGVLGLFSFIGAIAYSAVLRGQGSTAACGTFTECLSGTLGVGSGTGTGSGSGNTGGGSGGSIGGSVGGSIGGGTGGVFNWTPNLTSASIQLFCDFSRLPPFSTEPPVQNIFKWDPNKVSNDPSGILCLRTRLLLPILDMRRSKFVSFKFLGGGGTLIVDFYNNALYYASLNTNVDLKNAPLEQPQWNLDKYVTVDAVSLSLVEVDFSSGTANQLLRGVYRGGYMGVMEGYCDATGTSRADYAVPYIRVGLVEVLHKCSGVWNKMRVSWTSLSSAPLCAECFRLYDNIVLLYNDSDVYALPLRKLGECISSNLSTCSISLSRDTTLLASASQYYSYARSKLSGVTSLNTVVPSVVDGEIGLVESNYYSAIKMGNLVAYKQFDNSLQTVSGYLLTFVSDGNLVGENNGYCVYEGINEMGYKTTIRVWKYDTQCPAQFTVPTLYYIAMKNGTFLVGAWDTSGSLLFIGTLYPDTTQLESYAPDGLPFYQGAIMEFPFVVNAGTGFSARSFSTPLFYAGGLEFFMFQINSGRLGRFIFLVHFPDFSRNSNDLKRY